MGLDLLAANEEALDKAPIEIRYLDGWLETNKDEREILRIRVEARLPRDADSAHRARTRCNKLVFERRKSSAAKNIIGSSV